MFRLTHISDTHGLFPSVPESSVMIVHSGDMFPNLTRGIRDVEESHQRKWLANHMDEFRAVIGSRLFVFIPGNHDFYDPEADFKAAGINAVNIANKLVKLNGLMFYGFPWIPYIAEEWNYEVRSAELSELVSQIPVCDILVAHCPPYGICADTVLGKGGGSEPLMNHLGYSMDKLPSLLLCGHFHESAGIGAFENMIVSNAACTQHTFEVPL